MVNFINRKTEIESLERRCANNKFEFIPIYGRRRVGKTELIKEFAKNKKHIYFLGERTGAQENLNRFREKVAKYYKDEILGSSTVGWKEIFNYIKNKDERVILIIDEFPYLCELDKATSSIFQYIIDEIIKDSKIFLIFCGSSIGMMEKEVLFYKAPLYGRRTGQMYINPLKFKDVVKFFPNYSIKEKIFAYSITGGIPMYLNIVKTQRNIPGIIKNIISTDSLLYQEPVFLLREELREPRNYLLILKSIALGFKNFGKICNYTGISKNKLMQYLEILQDLRIVKRETPILSKPRTKISLYRIEDNFLNFWFRFVFPNKNEIEEGLKDEVISKINAGMDEYVAREIFEKICMEFLLKKQPFQIQEIGRWWRKEDEIDIVALNEETKEILFCECKWRERKADLNVLNELKEKAKLVQWHNDERREYYCIFSKSGFKDELLGKALLFDLNDFSNEFSK